MTFPSGRSAEELCPVDVAHVVWAANLGCLDLNPWAVRRSDVDHPDELRVDLDPQPGVEFSTVRRVAAEVQRGARGASASSAGRRPPARAGCTSTCGSSPAGTSSRSGGPRWRWRGRWSGGSRHRHQQVVEGGARHPRLPRLQPERARPDHRLGLLGARQPRGQGELPGHLGGAGDGEPGGPHHRHGARRASPGSGTWARASTTGRFSLEPLLELAARDEAQGLGDAPWPPHFPKQRGEPKRVQPSKARKEPEED